MILKEIKKSESNARRNSKMIQKIVKNFIEVSTKYFQND